MDGTANAMPSSSAKLEPAGPNHPCPKMRLAGRQNNVPEEWCMASTCVKHRPSLPPPHIFVFHQPLVQRPTVQNTVVVF